MNGFDIIEKALNILGKSRPNTLFATRDYIMFFEGSPPLSAKQETELEELGVFFVSKFECYGIDNDRLLEIAKNQD